MRLEEYLHTVTDQIRCVRARDLVSGELKDHILDQAEAFEKEGMFQEEALERAIREMGDPVETGVSLDRIHRPRISVEILVLISIISLISIALHVTLGVCTREVNGAEYGYLKNHVLYILLGYGLMLAVYRLDYSILSRCAGQAAAAFLLLAYVGIRFCSFEVNGARLYLSFGVFDLFIPTLMLLFVPLYGGVLYTCRGQGYRGLGAALLWPLAATWLTLRIPAFSQGIILWTACMMLTALAVGRNWYQVSRKWTFAGLGVLFAAPAWLFLGAAALGQLATYQTERMRAYLTNASGVDYYADRVREVLGGSRLLMGNAEKVTDMGQRLPGFHNDYIFVSLIAAYGILAGVLVVALLLFLVVKIFRISLGQKNQLGMILGCGCGIVYLLQLGISIAMPLGLLPTTAAIMPFFSSGGSGIVVSYVLLGLVLSVYRYKNILPGDAVRGGRRRKKADAAWQEARL